MGVGNEMCLRQASLKGGGDGGNGCTHFLGASLSLLLKLQVSGAGSSFPGGLGLPTFAAPTFPAGLPKKAVYLALLQGQSWHQWGWGHWAAPLGRGDELTVVGFSPCPPSQGRRCLPVAMQRCLSQPAAPGPE